MDKFRWAYIGCGSIASSTAAQILKGNHTIAAVYGRNYDKAAAFASKYGGKACRTFEQAVLSGDIDGVYIATPHTSHTQYALAAIKAGKPVLCEKPVAVNEADALKMINCAKEHNVYFAEAMWTWFGDTALKIKNSIQSGDIGNIKSIDISYSFPGVLMNKNSRVLTPSTAGGALLDIGIYPITYCYNLLGYPDKIICSGKIKNGIDISETVILYCGDTKCTLKTSLTSAKENCRIYGTKGKITIPLFHMAGTAWIKSGGKRKAICGVTDYLTEFTLCADEIKSGKTESAYVPFNATADCMRIMDECRRQMNLKYPFEK